MPYVSLKTFPRDKEAGKRVVEQIQEVLMKNWDIPADYISISLEEIAPEDWDSRVQIPEIDARPEIMMIKDGKKLY